MDVVSSVAQTAMSLSEFRVQQAVEVSMLKKVMEVQELQVKALIEQLPGATPPSASLIDVKV